MSSRRQKLLARVNWYLRFSLKNITEQITVINLIKRVVVTDRFHCMSQSCAVHLYGQWCLSQSGPVNMYTTGIHRCHSDLLFLHILRYLPPQSLMVCSDKTDRVVIIAALLQGLDVDFSAVWVSYKGKISKTYRHLKATNLSVVCLSCLLQFFLSKKHNGGKLVIFRIGSQNNETRKYGNISI